MLVNIHVLDSSIQDNSSVLWGVGGGKKRVASCGGADPMHSGDEFVDANFVLQNLCVALIM